MKGYRLSGWGHILMKDYEEFKKDIILPLMLTLNKLKYWKREVVYVAFIVLSFAIVSVSMIYFMDYASLYQWIILITLYAVLGSIYHLIKRWDTWGDRYKGIKEDTTLLILNANRLYIRLINNTQRDINKNLQKLFNIIEKLQTELKNIDKDSFY